MTQALSPLLSSCASPAVCACFDGRCFATDVCPAAFVVSAQPTGEGTQRADLLAPAFAARLGDGFAQDGFDAAGGAVPRVGRGVLAALASHAGCLVGRAKHGAKV